MKISEYFREEDCIMELKSKTKEEAIKEIAEMLYKKGKVKDIDKFISDILEREELGSTGIGHGIAIPHARTEAVSDFVIGFGRSCSGIDFNSIDGEKVNFVFLMGANPSQLNLYLRLLAELSKFLMSASCRKELMEAKDASSVIEMVKRFEGS